MIVLRNAFAALCLGTAVAACGGGGSGSSPADGNPPQPSLPYPEPAPESEPAPEPEPERPADLTALLRWQAPTSRTDDTCLSDLASYRISYGLSHQHYTETIDIAAEDLACVTTGNSSCGPVRTCSFLVENLESSTWHFAVQAIDDQGNVSDYSEEAIITVQ